MKIKFYVDTIGINGSKIEEEVDFSDDTSYKKIDDYLENWVQKNINYRWYRE